MVIALFLHLFLKKKFLLLIKYISILCSVFLICSIIFQQIIQDPKFHFYDNGVGSLPYTHYLMMGLEDPLANHEERRTYGGFSGFVLDYTKSIPSENRKQIHIEEIKRRFHSYTPIGLIEYYANKISNTWGDGTYFAPMKISQLPIKQSKLHSLVLQNGTYFKVYLYFAQGVQYALLIFLFLSTFIHRSDSTFSYLYLAIFGLFSFLLLWETRSRYLVNYIPIFIMTITPAIKFLSKPKKEQI